MFKFRFSVIVKVFFLMVPPPENSYPLSRHYYSNRVFKMIYLIHNNIDDEAIVWDSRYENPWINHCFKSLQFLMTVFIILFWHNTKTIIRLMLGITTGYKYYSHY